MKKYKKDATPSCTITLPLNPQPWQYDKLETDFSVACRIYNCLRCETWNRYNQMIRTKAWKATLVKAASKEEQQHLWAQRDTLRKKFRLSEFEFHRDVKKYQKHFPNNVHSQIAQKLATHLWQAYEKMLFSDGEAVHFCKFDEFYSVEGKNNTTGIVYENGTLRYGPRLKIEIPVSLNPKDAYQKEMLSRRVKFCRIVRKWVKTKWKYYLQLVLEGNPVVKTDPQTGEIKHPLAAGRVGIDIGTQTVAIVSDTSVHLLELAPEVHDTHKELHRIERAMDRSRRATNPENYNWDGTVKKGLSQWRQSKRYKSLKAKRRNICRKEADIRKQSHERLANEVLATGNELYVEDMNFKALQKRAKETKIKPDGKIASKKRFGKSLANKAPAKFIAILERKAAASCGQIIKVNPSEAKASQYNHLNQEYHKKKLSQRMNQMPDGRQIQRDLYSAFLLQCINKTLDGYQQTLCDAKYENFVVLHDAELNRLRGTQTFGSMGV